MDEYIERATARADLIAAYEDGRIATLEDILAVLDLVPVAEEQSTILTADSSARLAAIKDIPTQRLLNLAIAERDGRLVVLPCKVGDVVYRPVVRDEGGYIIWEVRVCSICISRDNYMQSSDYAVGAVLPENAGWTFDLSDLGKTVFLTRKEAEAAAAGLPGGGGT